MLAVKEQQKQPNKQQMKNEDSNTAMTMLKLIICQPNSLYVNLTKPIMNHDPLRSSLYDNVRWKMEVWNTENVSGF